MFVDDVVEGVGDIAGDSAVGEHEVEFEAVFDYVVHPGRGVVVGVFDFEGGFEVGAGGGAVVLGGQGFHEGAYCFLFLAGFEKVLRKS